MFLYFTYVVIVKFTLVRSGRFSDRYTKPMFPYAFLIINQLLTLVLRVEDTYNLFKHISLGRILPLNRICCLEQTAVSERFLYVNFNVQLSEFSAVYGFHVVFMFSLR